MTVKFVAQGNNGSLWYGFKLTTDWLWLRRCTMPPITTALPF